MNRLLTSLCVLAALVTALGPSTATAAVLAADMSGSGGLVSGFAGAPRTGGWRFTLSGSETVTALGYWDEGANGLSVSHQVGLWTDGGSLLGSVVVNNGGTIVSSAHSGGQWIFANLSNSLALGAGTYRVAGVIEDTLDPVRYDDSGGATLGETFAPGVTWLSTTYGPSGSGFAFPSFTNATTRGGYYGGNLMFDAVPEPTTLAIWSALGGLGMMVAARRRRKA